MWHNVLPANIPGSGRSPFLYRLIQIYSLDVFAPTWTTSYTSICLHYRPNNHDARLKSETVTWKLTFVKKQASRKTILHSQFGIATNNNEKE